MFYDGAATKAVIPAQAGIQPFIRDVRGHDTLSILFLETEL